MKNIYCIALAGEGTTGSLWFFDKAKRDASLGTNAADQEIPFTLKVEDGLSDEEIEHLVDEAETLDAYMPDAVPEDTTKGQA